MVVVVVVFTTLHVERGAVGTSGLSWILERLEMCRLREICNFSQCLGCRVYCIVFYQAMCIIICCVTRYAREIGNDVKFHSLHFHRNASDSDTKCYLVYQLYETSPEENMSFTSATATMTPNSRLPCSLPPTIEQLHPHQWRPPRYSAWQGS